MASNLELRERVFDPDPLANLKKKASRLEGLLENKGSRLSYSIFGTLHEGHISDQIRELVEVSDLVTLELPTIAVNSDFSPSRNLFWYEVLEFAKSRGKRIRGVNNNFAAVNSLRVLNGRDGYIPIEDSGPNKTTPFDFYVNKTMEIFGPFSLLYPEVFDLSLAGVTHLVRLRVDKTQMEQTLKYATSVVGDKDANGREIRVVHIGGAGHNPNLLRIAAEIFSNPKVISFREVSDRRVAPFAVDELTLFAGLIPIVEGLFATEIKDDNVFINDQKAEKILGDALHRFGDVLGLFFKRQNLVKKFEKVGNLQFEKFFVNFLLSLVDGEDLDSLPPVTGEFPIDLINFVKENYHLEEIEAARKLLEEGKRYFM